MIVPFLFFKNPFIAEKAEFGKIINTAAVFFFFVVVDIFSVVEFIKIGFDAMFLI
jgi:hypothetical protein